MKPASVITPTTRGAPGRRETEEEEGRGGSDEAAAALARLGRLFGRADDDATGEEAAADGGGGAPAALADEVRRVMAILYMGFLVRGSRGGKDAWAARLSLFMMDSLHVSLQPLRKKEYTVLLSRARDGLTLHRGPLQSAVHTVPLL